MFLLPLIGVVLPSLGMLPSTHALHVSSGGGIARDEQKMAAALRPKVDFTMIPRVHSDMRRLQSIEDMCDSVIKTVFATDPLSVAACTCESTTANEYALTCDYSSFCGTFCTDDPLADSRYECFDRTDYYTVLVTDEYIINSLYKGCGTYQHTPQTRVCYNESRDMTGVLSNRCLDINGRSCQCMRGLCGGYSFRCISPGPGTFWDSFVLDECVESAYADIQPDQVHALLSSDIFDLTSCFDTWTAAPTTTNPTFAPTSVPTKSILDSEQEEDGQPTSAPTTTPSAPSSPGPTQAPVGKLIIRDKQPPKLDDGEKDATFPTPGPTRTPTPEPTTAPVVPPTSSPSVEPTPAPSTVAPSSIPSSRPTGSPTLVPSPVPTTASPTSETIDVALAPFSMWFVRDANVQLSTLIAPVQRVLVTSLQSRYGASFYDLRLQCNIVDGAVVSRPTLARMECTGVSKFLIASPSPTEDEVQRAQYEILSDATDLSGELSAQLGRSVTVTETVVDVPVQGRENPNTEDGTDSVVAASSAFSAWPYSAVPSVTLIILIVSKLVLL